MSPLQPGDAVAIFGHHHQQPFINDITALFSLLAEKGFVLLFEKSFADHLHQEGLQLPDNSKLIERFPEENRPKLVISIGGDGTLLRAARWCEGAETPIVGINTGHLGFLVSYTLDESHLLVESLLAAEGFPVEKRSVLKLTCDGDIQPSYPYALNEIAILKVETASMINIRAAVNGHFLAKYMVDGLIVSTPTGSTAYNLSVGGPIIQPTLDCMVLSPVAPHTLTLRPVVISGDDKIHCTVSSRSGSCRISLDGESFVVPEDTSLHIERAPFGVLIVQRPGEDFSAVLRQKLYWGRR